MMIRPLSMLTVLGTLCFGLAAAADKPAPTEPKRPPSPRFENRVVKK